MVILIDDGYNNLVLQYDCNLHLTAVSSSFFKGLASHRNSKTNFHFFGRDFAK